MAFLRSIIKCSVSKKFRLNTQNINSILSTRNSAVQNEIQNRYRSSTAAELCDVKEGTRRDPLDTSFNDPEASFKSKTTLEILRAYIVYTLCSSSYLVEHNMEVIFHCINYFSYFYYLSISKLYSILFYLFTLVYF